MQRPFLSQRGRQGPERPSDYRSEHSLKPIIRILTASVSNSNETAQKIPLKALLVSSGQHFLQSHSACFLDKCSNSPPYILNHDLGTGRRNPRRLTKINRANRVAS